MLLLTKEQQEHAVIEFALKDTVKAAADSIKPQPAIQLEAVDVEEQDKHIVSDTDIEYSGLVIVTTNQQLVYPLIMLLTQTVLAVPSVPIEHDGVPENCPADDPPRVHVIGDGGTIVEDYENISFINSKIQSQSYICVLTQIFGCGTRRSWPECNSICR